MTVFRILTYHRIGLPRGGRRERLTVPPARFKRQLRLVPALRLDFTNLEAVHACLRGGAAAGRGAVALTFDDGYRDLCEHALPELVERAIPALVFLVARRDHDSWTSWGSRTNLPLMDWSQVREFAEAGISFGSHTLTHPDLTRLDDVELRTELADSKKTIEDRIGQPVRHFCYPYGSHDDRVVEAVRAAGYRTACTTRRGAVRPGADGLRLPRLSIGSRMWAHRFALRLLWRHERR